MTTKQTKTEDPRDARIAELEATLAHQQRDLAAALPRTQEQKAAFERRQNQARRDARECEVIAMTDEHRLAAIADANAHGDLLWMLRVTDSFVEGGVRKLFRLADETTKALILAAHPNAAQLQIDAAAEDELRPAVRIMSAVMAEYFAREAAGEALPKPSVPAIGTHVAGPYILSDSEAARYAEVGLPVRVLGKDNLPHAEGFSMGGRDHVRDFVDLDRDQFVAIYETDVEFRELIKARVLVVRDLTPQELRSRMSIARDISVSHG